MSALSEYEQAVADLREFRRLSEHSNRSVTERTLALQDSSLNAAAKQWLECDAYKLDDRFKEFLEERVKLAARAARSVARTILEEAAEGT